MYPTVGDFLTHIKDLNPGGKLWASFGSYGWSKGAIKDISKIFEDAGFNTIGNNLEIQYAPSAEELESCIEFGRKIARQIKKMR